MMVVEPGATVRFEGLKTGLPSADLPVGTLGRVATVFADGTIVRVEWRNGRVSDVGVAVVSVVEDDWRPERAEIAVSLMSDEAIEELLLRAPDGYELVTASPRQPGKFEMAANHELAEALWDRMADAEDEDGDVQSPHGFFARIGRFIVMEDDRGFVTYEEHPGEDDAIRDFSRRQIAFDAWDHDDLR
jgi:hypothetical protein